MTSATFDRLRLAGIAAAARGRRGIGPWLIVLVVVYLSVQMVLVLASLWSAAIPNAPVIAALQQGLDTNLWSSTDYPADGVGHGTARFPFAGVSDAYTQCIALTMNVPTTGNGLWEAAFAGRHLGACSAAVPALGQIVAGADAPFLTYNRYWNGYAALTRPLLALGGVGAVRLVVATLFVATAALAIVMLARHVSRWAPLALLPLAVSTNIVLQPLDAFPHALAFAVILAGVAGGARLGREPLPLVFLGAAVAASLFNFVDYLLNPPVAWALFVFAVVAARWMSGRGRLRGVWAAAGVAATGWIAGYGVTWVTRWAIAVATFGDAAWQEILGVVGTRLRGQADGLVFAGPLQATRRNVLYWMQTIPTAPAVAALAGAALVIALVSLLVTRRWRALAGATAMALPAAIVPVWFELLNNHSQIHLFFVYRAVPTAVGIIGTAALVAAFGARRGGQAAGDADSRAASSRRSRRQRREANA